MAQPQQHPSGDQKQQRQPGREGPMTGARLDPRGLSRLRQAVRQQRRPHQRRRQRYRPLGGASFRPGGRLGRDFLSDEHDDAAETARLLEAEGAGSLLIQGDVTDSALCTEAVERTVERFGRLDVLVNNAAQQYVVSELSELGDEQIERSFRTNIFGYTYMARAAEPHLEGGGCIIDTGSITGFRGHAGLIDYAATTGAIQALIYSLALKLIDKGIRVNGVAPGPVWTPLIPASFPEER